MRNPLKVLNLFFFIAFCLVFVSILLFTFYGNIELTGKNPENNTIVIYKDDIIEERVVALYGEVQFYGEELLTPENFNSEIITENQSSVNFPDTWNKRTFSFLYSRHVVGWDISNSLDAICSLEVLK